MNTKIDPVFDKAVDEYVDSVITQEKSEFRPGLESFEVYADKLRRSLSDGLHAYRETYRHGYQVLLEKLREILPQKETLEAFQINPESNQVLDDPEALMAFIAEGKSLYQLFGFSPKILAKFCWAACHLLQEQRFEEARDAFFFLVLVAPQYGKGWLGLGYSYLQCGEYKAAELACSKALDLDPNNSDVYLTYVRLFIAEKNIDKANQVCELGAFRAAEHPDEPWAKGLAAAIEETQHQIAKAA